MHDVLMVSDLRLRGGVTASMAEEIRAQAAAGYRTALLHVNSPLVTGVAGISAHLTPLIDDGVADLALPGDEIRARHALVRDPRVAEHIPGPFRNVTVESVSLIAHHPAISEGAPQYDPAAATTALTTCFRRTPVVRPVGPPVRHSLSGEAGVDLSQHDWHDILDIDRWFVRRTGVAGIPVVGRHARPHRDAWPTDASELLAAYPDSGEVEVRILGGAAPAEALLGTLPARWRVEPLDSRDPYEFLADLDFFIYHPHPSRVRASERTVLEALASGAVVILPERFRPMFGDVAIYATPRAVPAVVAELSGDPDAYVAQSQRGQDLIRSRHSYQAHAARLAGVIGPARCDNSPARPRGAPRHTRARVLFVTTNGTGMGHLTRLLAMATRSTDRIEPFFLSLSTAVPVVATYGYGWEYCPSRDELDSYAKEWHPLFTTRLIETIKRYRPRALVFDGVSPYDGLGFAREQFPQLPLVWSRRPMWQQGIGHGYLERSSWFDLIIEPGEFAASADRGATVDRSDAVRVRPITLLNTGDLLDRKQARAALGIGFDDRAALVTLGGGNDNDLTSDLEIVADAFGHRPGWQVYATQAPISRAATPARTDVTTVSVYPLAKYLAAFDLSITACGYNAYHESIMAGLPTIFVPKTKVVDDQHARARYAADVGVGVAVDEVAPALIDKAVDRLLDQNEETRVRERCMELYPGNGAAEAMRLVEDLLAQRGVLR